MTRKSCTFTVCAARDMSRASSLSPGRRRQPAASVNSGDRSTPIRLPMRSRARLRAAAADPAADRRVHHWNQIAIDSRRPRSHAGRARRSAVFGEQLGPGRSARAMAIVHIAIFDAVNAIARRYRSYTGIADARPARRWTPPSRRRRTTRWSRCSRRRRRIATSCSPRSWPRSATAAARAKGISAGAARRARHPRAHAPTTARITPSRGSASTSSPSNRPGNWRQDPISQLPLALGAHWGEVTPFVICLGPAHSACRRRRH